MRFEYTDGRNQDFVRLCKELDISLNEQVGGEENRTEYVQYNKLDDIHDVVIAYDENNSVGCASFKKYNDESAEVKRVYVKSEYRRRGIAYILMELIETSAKAQGFQNLILETGEQMESAIALYKKIGYEVIPNYGQYANMPESICMMKKL